MHRVLIVSAILGCFLTSPFAFWGQEPTVEHRLERLEEQVNRLLALHGVISDSPDVPSELEGNIHTRFGYPGGDGTLLVKDHYVISHRNDLKVPEWVAYHLSRENLQGIARRTNDFRPDPELPAGERSELSDYRNSGFDRGHMAPAAAFKRSRVAMSATFPLSNMTPQTPNLNRRIWRELEQDVRSLARAHGRIWVFTGILFLDANGNPAIPSNHIGNNRVAVPTHFYKAILCEHPSGTREMFSFIMPNQRSRIPGDPRDYIGTIDRIEELTGLDFFAALPDTEEDRLEGMTATNWPIQ